MRKFIDLILMTIIIISLIGCTSVPAITQSTPMPESTPTPSPSPKVNWTITNLSYAIIEKNDSWWKFSWQATVTNKTEHIVEFFITVNFLDSRGFIVDDDIVNPIVFAPLERRTIKGYALVDTEIAPNIKSIEVGDIDAYKSK